MNTDPDRQPGADDGRDEAAEAGDQPAEGRTSQQVASSSAKAQAEGER